MKVLNHRDIQLRIKRLAIEILEHNTQEPHLMLAGINNNGLQFAQLLFHELQRQTLHSVELTRIQLNPANPIEKPAQLKTPAEKLHQTTVIIVDDLANTGRTLFYACQPLMQILPRSVQMAVLVDRTHKTFPIQPNYVGLSLATTLQENIQVNLTDKQNMSVFLL